MKVSDLQVILYALPEWDGRRSGLYFDIKQERWIISSGIPTQGTSFLTEEGFWGIDKKDAIGFSNPEMALTFYLGWLELVPDLKAYRKLVDSYPDDEQPEIEE